MAITPKPELLKTISAGIREFQRLDGFASVLICSLPIFEELGKPTKVWGLTVAVDPELEPKVMHLYGRPIS